MTLSWPLRSVAVLIRHSTLANDQAEEVHQAALREEQALREKAEAAVKAKEQELFNEREKAKTKAAFAVSSSVPCRTSPGLMLLVSSVCSKSSSSRTYSLRPASRLIDLNRRVFLSGVPIEGRGENPFPSRRGAGGRGNLRPSDAVEAVSSSIYFLLQRAPHL